MEISSVWFAGSTNLYSKEFYEIASRRVGDAGVLQQWIQLHHIGLEELQTVLATVRVIFPHVTFWVFGAQGIVVASQSPLELTVEGAAHFFEGASALGLDPAHAGELFERALATQLLSESDVTKMASDPAVTINTDRNRRLEFASARHAMDAADVATRNVVALARGAAFRPLDVTPDYPPEARALVERADAKRIRALASSSR